MFTDKGQALIQSAKAYAFAYGSPQLDTSALVVAMSSAGEPAVLLAECLGITASRLKKLCPKYPNPVEVSSTMPLEPAARNVIVAAKDLASETPDRANPGLIDLRHLACAIALSSDACALLGVSTRARTDINDLLAAWYHSDSQAPRIDDINVRLRRLQAELNARVFGQDHAIMAFIEGLFNAEVVAGVDTGRTAPRGIFVFAGPPGVGKTYLSELCAGYLERPFKRFDMSAYSNHYQSDTLVGISKSYKDARAGTLTEFVENNPNAVLLFDEIEKAHITTVLLFLQVLDGGRLEDKFHERNVSFRDTLIIFTTNTGRSLYDKPNFTGVHRLNSSFHRRTILDAIENEKDPQTGQPVFPAALCSRLATGYPVLFNHLGVNELEKVVRAELERTAELLERQYYKHISFDDLISTCLVLREGSRADARMMRAQTEVFVKTELFKFCQLFETDHIAEAFGKVDALRFVVDGYPRALPAEVHAIFETTTKPCVLLVADAEVCELFGANLTDMSWKSAQTAEQALASLATDDIDFVLFDIWVDRATDSVTGTSQQFDHVPFASSSLDRGQEILRKLHERLPDMPVYMLSVETGVSDPLAGSSGLDEALFLACVRAGGARGIVSTGFVDTSAADWSVQRDLLAQNLQEVALRLYRERQVAELGRQQKCLAFDTAPRLRGSSREVSVRLRNLRLASAFAAADIGEVLQEVERPTTRFSDVIGADAAKEELRFFADYLKNPRRFAALGLKPPRGVLLHGPPGTGKTMLARAMAGESSVAFIPAVASSFVTIWQGSGPQSVRDLFERARRYAPAILFIDEVDAIGRVRTGSPGSGHAEEMTLNALLTELDGFTGGSAHRPVFVLAATNFRIDSDPDAPERTARALDPALVRRFDRSILVDLPDRAGRTAYLTQRLAKQAGSAITEAMIELIAGQTVGMNIASLEHVIETAIRTAARGDGKIADAMLEEALHISMFGQAREQVAARTERTARHEAGHAVMYWLSGWCPLYVTVVSRSDFGGYMQFAPEDVESGMRTREQIINRIRVSLAGRASEFIFYGEHDGMTTGVRGDLESATRMAREMACAYGMVEQIGLVSLYSADEMLKGPMAPKINREVTRLLQQEFQYTVETLGKHREHVNALALSLIDKNRLTSDEVRELLKGLPQGGT